LMSALAKRHRMEAQPGRLCCDCSCPVMADTVAKRFWAREPAILIQDQAARRNVDSKSCSFRFNCCGHDAPRRLLQQYRHISDLPNGPEEVRLSKISGSIDPSRFTSA